MDNARNILNGAIAGFVTVFITQPLQVIRTNMMVTYCNNKPTGFLYITKKLKQEEGLRGFYRGLVPTIIKTPIGTAIFFGCLEYNKKFLKKKNSVNLNKNSINFISSAIARFAQCVLINPILVIITRFEVMGFKSYNSVLDAFIKIKREEGFRGYFTGLKPLIIKEIPTAALFYSFYEIFKKIMKSFGVYNIQLQASVSAALANTVLVFLNNPIDVIRTRLQYVHFSHNRDHQYKGIISGIKRIAQTEGVKGLTVGMVPRILKRATSSAIAWSLYETLKIRKVKKI